MRMTSLRAAVRDRRGIVFIMVAAGFTALAGMATVAVDVGQIYYTRAQLQNTADAAALAAARQLPNVATATTVATAMATANMPTAAGNGTVLVAGDITFGSWNNALRLFTPAGNPVNGVRVVTRRTNAAGNPVPLFFAQILGFNNVDVIAQAIASGDPGSGGFCFLAKHPTTASAFKANGNVSLNLGNCGIAVNSSHASKAFDASGTVNITGSAICVKGGANQSGQGTINPAPEEGCAPPADPLIGLAAPAFDPTACDQTNFKVSGSGGNVTVNPGVYCGGIEVSGSNNNVVFNPGGYVLKGGGLKLSGGGNVLSNPTTGIGGVTFFNTTQPSGTSVGDIDFSGSSSGLLTAPTSGPYAGVLFFQDPALSSSVKFKVAGTVSLKLDGVVYFPNQEIDFSGTSDQSLRCLKLVGSTITFSGTSTTTVPPSCVSDAVNIGAPAVARLRA